MTFLNVFVFGFVFLSGFLLPCCVYGGNTICDDEKSCQDESIDITGTAYCRGYYACDDATIDSEIAYCTGNKGCYSADITTSGTAYCKGFKGCTYADVDSEDIYCSGNYGCSSATLDSDNDIYCTGNYACLSSTMEAADYIYSNGSYSAAYSTIKDTERVYSYGNYGLQYGNITSVDVDSLKVYLYGYYSGYGLDIICTSSASCEIYCGGYGCINVDITCNGDDNCEITCDSNCTDECPTSSTFYDYEIWNNYQQEKQLLKKNAQNKFLQLEKEYVGDGDDNDDYDDDSKRNEFYDMNNNDGISKYIHEFDDQFIELRHKYGIGIDKKHNNERKNLIVDNYYYSNSNSNSFLIGIICLVFSLFGIIIYQCYIIDKYTKDSKYINIA